jgi:hypothetical protein
VPVAYDFGGNGNPYLIFSDTRAFGFTVSPNPTTSLGGVGLETGQVGSGIQPPPPPAATPELSLSTYNVRIGSGLSTPTQAYRIGTTMCQ